MAKPPEPIVELLAECDAIFVGEVVELLSLGKPPKQVPSAIRGIPGAVDVPTLLPSQRLKIRVERVLHGRVQGEVVELDKPEGVYTLRKGNRGPFFIKAGSIIGRYGPDTYNEPRIVAALAKN